ncbi:MAG: cytochrome c [Gammaproteobacteria bacterium]
MLAGTSVTGADFPEGPELGDPADAQRIEHWDRSIMPGGQGLPSGSGGVEEGRAVYEQYCQVCHAPGGVGDSGDQLAGARMDLTSDWPEKTIGNYWPYATTLFDFIRRSMPMTAPQSLSNDEVYAVTAYLLYLNDIIGENDILDAETLSKIEMPNRDGFIDSYK